MIALLMAASLAYAEPAPNIVIDLVDGATHEDLVEVARVAHLDTAYFLAPETEDEALAVAYSTDPEAVIGRLQDHRLVEVVELEVQYRIQGSMGTGFSRLDNFLEITATPNDPDYAKQWHMKDLQAEWVWANTKSGKGIKVAVLDTGVTKTFDMDEARLLPGKSFVPGESVEDGHGHGTHCAATIAETTGNGLGATGLAKDATILPVKVLSNMGFGNSSWIAAGIDYAADQGADVISMSLGGSRSDVIIQAIDRAIAKGVIVVAAAGNDGNRGRESMGWPANHPPVIAVGATGPDGKRSPYSSYGKQLDIMAPGGNKAIRGGGVFQITRFEGKDSLQEWQGTSMATPHVAGAAAILLGEGAPHQQKKLEVLLIEGGDDSPPTEHNEYGKAILNVKGALKLLKTEEAIGSKTVAVTETLGQHWLPTPSPAGRWTYLVTALSVATVLVMNRIYGFSRSFLGVALGTAVLSGGGLYFLTELPFLSAGALNGLAMFAVPWLEYPEYLLGPGMSGFPLWLSPLPLLLPYLLLTPWGRTRALVVGLLSSGLAYLALDTALGFNTLWWLGAFGTAIWTGLSAMMLAGLTTVACEFNRVNQDT